MTSFLPISTRDYPIAHAKKTTPTTRRSLLVKVSLWRIMPTQHLVRLCFDWNVWQMDNKDFITDTGINSKQHENIMFTTRFPFQLTPSWKALVHPENQIKLFPVGWFQENYLFPTRAIDTVRSMVYPFWNKKYVDFYIMLHRFEMLFFR